LQSEGDVGFNRRRHRERYDIELKPDGSSWNQAEKQKLIVKVEPENYTLGMGTGFLPGEEFPGK
jgi:hypothetical protein